MVIGIALWLFASAVVAYFGRGRALGFWGVLIYSVLFSPIAGVFALVVFKSRLPKRSGHAAETKRQTVERLKRENEALAGKLAAVQPEKVTV